MASLEEQAKEFEIKAVMISLIVSAFGFVAALFWRDAIGAFIDEVIPEGQGLGYQFIAASIVTVMAVIVIFVLTKYVAGFSMKEHVKKIKSNIKKKKPKTRKTEKKKK